MRFSGPPTGRMDAHAITVARVDHDWPAPVVVAPLGTAPTPVANNVGPLRRRFCVEVDFPLGEGLPCAILAMMETTRSGGGSLPLPPGESKLAPPRIRRGIVVRERLFAALDALDGVELTLVSGPAGAGESMLVASWLASKPDAAQAWVTLDHEDDEPVRLLTHIAAALDHVRAGLAE